MFFFPGQNCLGGSYACRGGSCGHGGRGSFLGQSAVMVVVVMLACRAG